MKQSTPNILLKVVKAFFESSYTYKPEITIFATEDCVPCTWKEFREYVRNFDIFANDLLSITCVAGTDTSDMNRYTLSIMSDAFLSVARVIGMDYSGTHPDIVSMVKIGEKEYAIDLTGVDAVDGTDSVSFATHIDELRKAIADAIS